MYWRKSQNGTHRHPAVIRQFHHNSLIIQSFVYNWSMAKSRNTSPGVTVWNITQVKSDLTVQLLDCGTCVCYPRHHINDHDLYKIYVRSCFLLPSSLECYHFDLSICVVHSKQLNSTYQMLFSHSCLVCWFGPFPWNAGGSNSYDLFQHHCWSNCSICWNKCNFRTWRNWCCSYLIHNSRNCLLHSCRFTGIVIIPYTSILYVLDLVCEGCFLFQTQIARCTITYISLYELHFHISFLSHVFSSWLIFCLLLWNNRLYYWKFPLPVSFLLIFSYIILYYFLHIHLLKSTDSFQPPYLSIKFQFSPRFSPCVFQKSISSPFHQWEMPKSKRNHVGRAIEPCI